MKPKMITIKSEFPASADVIWDKLKLLETLQYIAAPYALFTPINTKEIIWKPGHTFQFDLRIYRFIRMGIHTINVLQFDKEMFTVYTEESNKSVPVWNHTILLKRNGDDKTYYTDVIEVSAGWKTPFVCIWSSLFYRHRQKKWRKLLWKSNGSS